MLTPLTTMHKLSKVAPQYNSLVIFCGLSNTLGCNCCESVILGVL